MGRYSVLAAATPNLSAPPMNYQYVCFNFRRKLLMSILDNLKRFVQPYSDDDDYEDYDD